jgi:hypothetical protein
MACAIARQSRTAGRDGESSNGCGIGWVELITSSAADVGGRIVLLADIGDGLFRCFQYVAFGILLLALLVGCGFVFLLGVIRAWRAAVLALYGIRVEGRVVGNHVEAGGTEGPIECRIVEFTDLQGNTQRHRLTVSSDGDPPVGQPMRLVYNPSDPEEVSGASLAQLWMFPLIACVCGGFGMVGVLCAVGQVIGVLPQN